MGKIKQGILGGFSGKVGPVIGAAWKGIAYMRGMALSHYDPKTQEQLEQRAKFGMMSKFVALAGVFIKIGFKSAESGTTAQDEAMSYNLKNAVSGTYPNYSPDLTKVRFATGSLPNVESPNATDDSAGNIHVTWTDNSGVGEATGEDPIMVLFYDKDKNDVRMILQENLRASEEVTLETPLSWSGDTVHVYCYAKSVKSSNCSTSTHVGSVIAS